MTQIYDVAVIGNGALGLSTAYQLKRADKNLRLAVIGPEGRPFSATATAGAMINVWAEITRDHFAFPALSDKAELGIRGMEMWDGLCAELSEFSEKPLKVQWGTYIVNNAQSSGLETSTLDYIVKVMQGCKVDYAEVRPDSIPWFFPKHRSPALRMVKIPDGRIDGRPVMDAYEKALGAKGATLLSDRVVKISGKGSFVLDLESGGKLEAKQVVLANGSFAQRLVDQMPEVKKATPRLVWGGGSAIDLHFPEWVCKGGGIDPNIFKMDMVIRTVDRGGACGIHVVPQGDGKFYLGASSGVWFDPEWAPRVHGIHVLLHSVVEEISQAFFYATMVLRGPGFRPTTVDGFPLLGQSHVNGLWFANGTKRDGFTASPFIAAELTQGILGNRHRLPPRFRPSRPLLSYKTKAQALEDSLAAQIGGEYQHGLALPPYALQPYMAMRRKELESLYAKRNMGDFGIHPEVTHLYENDETFAAINHPRTMVEP